MAYYEQQNKRRFLIGQQNNALVMLISINLIVFCILAFIKLMYFVGEGDTATGLVKYNTNFLQWVGLPADTNKLLVRPWTVLTHMFVHDNVWHIIGNMIWLWVFGYIFQDFTGNRKIIPVYIYGALAGALAFILAYNLLPALKPGLPVATAIGASAGIMAIAVATTMIAPDFRFFPFINGGIPLWVITLIYVIIDFAQIPYSNYGGHIAHLAGATMGFLFIYLMRRGHDWSEWMNNAYDWVNNLFNPDKPKKGKSIKEELFYKSNSKPFTRTPNLTQKRIDDILDKINQKGFESLTQEEKDLLKKAAEEDV
jgi:membrane associated rhomboid family serine protease